MILHQAVAVAQTAITGLNSNDVIVTAWQDVQYVRLAKEVDFFDDADLELPLLEEAELRTQTRDFTLTDQQYTARFQFNSLRQRKLQRSVNAYERSMRIAAQEEALEVLLYERYHLVVEYVLLEKEQAFLQQQQATLAEQMRYAAQQVSQYGDDATDDWLKLQDDELQLRLRTEDLAHRRAQLQRKLNGYLPNAAADFTANQVLTAESLAAIGLQLADTLPVPSRISRQALEVGLAQTETEAEQAANRQLLEFLQVRYRGDRDPTFPARVSIGAAMRLPLRNENSIDEQYLRLEELEEENQLDELIDEYADNYRLAQANLRQALDDYQFALAEKASYETTFGPTVLQQKGVQNLRTIFIAKAGVEQRQALALKREATLYRSYLEVLRVAGCLAVQPYHNWLTDAPLARF
ncbi:MAG: hypothetical protein AAGJ82_07380 [Bacteroidota bacterium]